VYIRLASSISAIGGHGLNVSGCCEQGSEP
jgi:hypothetical protein